MSIHFVGDPHGNFKPILRVLRDVRPDAAIILGDLDLPDALEVVFADVMKHTAVWWIAGNHDGDRTEWYDRLFGSALASACLHGRVVEIAGLRIAGLSGVFRETIWHPDTGISFERRDWYLNAISPRERWRGGLPRKHRVSIWYEDYERLANQRADILVTHEAPSCHRHGFEVLDELAALMGVHAIIHGHHHERYTAQLERYGIAVQGVAASGIVDQLGRDVLPGRHVRVGGPR